MSVNKKPILLILIFLLCGCSSTVFEKTSPEEVKKLVSAAQSSKLIILDVYHDRCESCKYIEPVMEKLKLNYANDPKISFLKYNLSNPFTVMRSRKIAKKIGLDGIYKVQRFSGIVLIIDTKTKEVLDTLIAEYNIEKYNEVIKSRLNAT